MFWFLFFWLGVGFFFKGWAGAKSRGQHILQAVLKLRAHRGPWAVGACSTPSIHPVYLAKHRESDFSPQAPRIPRSSSFVLPIKFSYLKAPCPAALPPGAGSKACLVDSQAGLLATAKGSPGATPEPQKLCIFLLLSMPLSSKLSFKPEKSACRERPS